MLAELDALIVLHKNGKDEKAIAQITGARASRQRRLMRLANLSAGMMKALHDGILPLSRAYRVAKMAKQKQSEVWQNFMNRTSGEGKISDEDIAPVVQVQVQQALDSLPDSIFAPVTPAEKGPSHDELLTALEELLSLTEHLCADKATSSEFRNEWQRISAQVADWRDGSDV